MQRRFLRLHARLQFGKIFFRRCTDRFLEQLDEIRNVIKAELLAYYRQRRVGFEKLAGVKYPEAVQILKIGFAGIGIKLGAKIVFIVAEISGNIVERYFFRKRYCKRAVRLWKHGAAADRIRPARAGG